jgi:1,4-dihydroxy-2-naphthoate octaprenyltransferase
MSFIKAGIDCITVSDSKASVSFSDWISGARLRTLPLAFSPVILGTASAYWRNAADVLLAGLAVLVAVAIQIGVNYANDYSDGIRGTDDYRVGPARLTGSGRVEPRLVKRAAILAFAVSVVAGLALVVLSQSWWLLVIGGFALFAAWTYTGGTSPYGYRGLGELVVFVFFGLVATVGTAYVQVGVVPWESWVTGSALGFFASAVLLENNLRDIDQDKAASKNTLSVRIGPVASRLLITVMLVGPYLILAGLSFVFVFAPVVFITAVLTAVIAVIVWRAKTPKDLIVALQLTTLNSLLFAIGLGLAIAF